VQQQEMIEAKGPIHLEKQDLPFSEPLESVGWHSTTMPVFGAVSRVEVQGAKVEGRFSDGSPAVTIKVNGKGRAVYCAFLPGLTYFKPALPRRPVDRSSRDDSLCHFVPHSFDTNASALIGSIAGPLDRPIVCSNPLVETTVIEGRAGTVITLNNWSGKPANNLRVWVNFPLHFQKAALASGRPVRVSEEDGTVVCRLDLDVADGLILR